MLKTSTFRVIGFKHQPNYFIVFLRKIAICEELCLIFSQFAHNRIFRIFRIFRFLYVFWVDFGTKCVNFFRFLYVFWPEFGTKCGSIVWYKMRKYRYLRNVIEPSLGSIDSTIASESRSYPDSRNASPPPWKPFSIAMPMPATVAPA